MGGRGSRSSSTRSRRTVDDCKTRAEIEQYAKDLGIKLGNGVSKLSDERLREVVRAYEGMIDIYGNLIPPTAFNVNVNMRIADETSARFDFWRGVELGRLMVASDSEFDRVIGHSIRKGFTQDGTTPASIVAHELGHGIQRSFVAMETKSMGDAGYAWNRDSIPGEIMVAAFRQLGVNVNYNPEAVRVFKTRMPDFRDATTGASSAIREMQRITDSISGYASMRHYGPGETMAECVADYYMNGRNASELSIAVHNEIMRRSRR